MGLSDQISAEMKKAMKEKDALRLDTLRTVRAQLVEMTKRGDSTTLSPDDELSVLTTAVKKRREAIEQYQKAGREDLATKEQAELEIIRTFLPKELSPQEAEQVVERIIRDTASSSQKDFGKVMGLSMKELKGRIDGSVVQEIVKKRLQG